MVESSSNFWNIVDRFCNALRDMAFERMLSGAPPTSDPHDDVPESVRTITPGAAIVYHPQTRDIKPFGTPSGIILKNEQFVVPLRAHFTLHKNTINITRTHAKLFVSFEVTCKVSILVSVLASESNLALMHECLNIEDLKKKYNHVHLTSH
jgi:hypothetical protein